MHIKLKSMKGMDFSCASPASTAICSSMDQRSMVRNGTKSLHRLNSYLGDHYKTLTNNINKYSPPRAPCISELPFTPRPSSYSYREKKTKITSVKHSDVVMRRKSSADISDIKRYKYKYSYDDTTSINNSATPSCHSGRYLLGESTFLDSLQESDNSTRSYTTTRTKSMALVPSTPVFGSEGRRSTSRVEAKRFGSLLDAEKEKQMRHFALIGLSDQEVIKLGSQQSKHTRGTYYDGHTQRQRSMGSCRNDSLVKSSSSVRSRDQVVVLRVSLHCKGCEGKLRKHLSKMEGVTSFSIDLETKKVTVTGNVTPLGVLTSISKVKSAQFWPSPVSTSSTSTSSSASSTVDFN